MHPPHYVALLYAGKYNRQPRGRQISLGTIFIVSGQLNLARQVKKIMIAMKTLARSKRQRTQHLTTLCQKGKQCEYQNAMRYRERG